MFILKSKLESSTELQVNKANSTDIKVVFSNLDLFISGGLGGMIFNFDFGYLPFLETDIPRYTLIWVYIPHSIRFATLF